MIEHSGSPTPPRNDRFRQEIARRTAKFLFAASLVFLFCQAVLVVLWTDVPMLVEAASGSLPEGERVIGEQTRLVGERLADVTLTVMLLIWPLVILEAIFHWFTRPWNLSTLRYHLFGVLHCLCPSLRMCARSLEVADRVWLPGLGWRRLDRRLRIRLERLFSVPMIGIALLILPVLILEFFFKTQVAQSAALRLALHFSTGLIWFAFAGEFILMFSVAEKKLDYCRKNWLDLAIILLPFISFLRSLRALRATRAAKLLRVSQLARFARMYRLRATALKGFRALVVLDLFRRLLGGYDGSIKRMRSRLDEIESEARQLRADIRRLERRRSRELSVPSQPRDPQISNPASQQR